MKLSYIKLPSTFVAHQEFRDQLRQRLLLREGPARLAGVRHRPDQQVRAPVQAPVRGRVGELEPVPLRLLTRGVVDDRLVPAGRGRARLAVRS